MDRRPIYLNFLTLRFNITAIVSFLHRLSGFFLFLFIPLILWSFQKSLQSETEFATLQVTFSSLTVKTVMLILSMALIYHLFAGLRHLLMDIHLGESKLGGRVSAWLVLSLSFIVIMIFGFWIFLRSA